MICSAASRPFRRWSVPSIVDDDFVDEVVAEVAALNERVEVVLHDFSLLLIRPFPPFGKLPPVRGAPT
jgi:hypothetical protein